MEKAFTGHEAKTNIIDTKDFFVCSYHNTNVVEYDKHEKYLTLKNDNHWTNTTKKRINQCFQYLNLEFHLYQRNYAWYISGTSHPKDIPFKNNMIIKL